MSEQDGLKCQECGRREATIHVTDFVEGQAVQRHLCEECYSSREEAPVLSSTDLFAQLIGALAPELEEAQSEQCPECGITYLEFRQNLVFGCPQDYEVFSEPLEELLESIHGANRHVGRVPRGSAQGSARGPRLEVLRRELNEAVAEENYEVAARIRDQINELEHERVGNSD
jgi:protein arginine kinase activator